MKESCRRPGASPRWGRGGQGEGKGRAYGQSEGAGPRRRAAQGSWQRGAEAPRPRKGPLREALGGVAKAPPLEGQTDNREWEGLRFKARPKGAPEVDGGPRGGQAGDLG